MKSEMNKEPISIAEKMYRELPVTIKGRIGWYDGFYLDYDGKELHQAIDKMMLNTGDKIEITISKSNER